MTVVLAYPDGATPLDPDEMEGLKHRHVTTRGELDELEQSNIQDGLQWLSTARTGHVLSDAFALLLHKRLFGGVWSWAGSIRRTEKNIGIDPLYIRVALRNLMDDVGYWRQNNTYPPKEAAVRLHHRLVFIHPFANGNGRHARIMADTVLKRVYGEEPIDWAGGQDLQKINDRRIEYIEALRSADRGDFGPLFDFAGIRT